MKQIGIVFTLSAAAFMLYLLISAVPVSACTGIYVGPEVSEDGTVIFARSNDHMSVWPNYIELTDHVDNKKGRKMPVSIDGSVMTDIPETTYKYISTPWMDSTVAENGMAHDAGVCANEYGVAMSMSVTAHANETAQKADPYVETGVSEQSATDYLICQCRTARETVELLLDSVDLYGCNDGAVAFIADQNEAWLAELYTGYQYAAVKLPADKVSAFGNEFTLEYLSDYEEFITSKDLEELPKKEGFARYGRDGEFNIRETYLGTENYIDYSHLRTWIGHKTLAPSAYGDYDREAQYPAVFAPDEKVSVQDVMELMRNRYEGTEFSPDETGRYDVRVIGTDTAMNVHVVQIDPDIPEEMCCTVWESAGPAICGVFVPVSNGVTEISRPYGGNQGKSAAGTFDTDHYAWYIMKDLTTLGMQNYQAYALPVREYWHGAETDMIAGMDKVRKEAASLFKNDRKKAEKLLTQYCTKMQENAFSDGKQLLNCLNWYVNNNSNTLKKVFDPETGLILDEDVKVKPLEIKIDGADYS